MDVTAWLMEGDPAIRWQVMRDLTDAPRRAVTEERMRIATEGWGVRLLDLQADDGCWGDRFYVHKWISTNYTLLLIRHLGLDPSSGASRLARDRLFGGGRTWSDGSGFFEYLGETCVTAMNLKLACHFDATSARTREVVEWLLGGQLADGGWNCETVRGSQRSSFHTTISTLEGLLEFERSGLDEDLTIRCGAARDLAHQYLLDRKLGRSLASGEVINPSWNRFSFPPRWWFDVLRGLDYLRDAAVTPDERWSEALDLLKRKRTKDGRWKLQNHHSGQEHFRMEDPGQPSRWNTLRALRVQRWAESHKSS